MSDIVKFINESDCVGDSLGKHNYNFLSLDQTLCNLSSQFFNIDDNFLSNFIDLSANIEKFNKFADLYEYPFDLNETTIATSYLSAYWQNIELNLTFPVNIYDGDQNTRYYMDEKTPISTLESWGLTQLQRKYPETKLNNFTTANVYFLLYSNIGKKTTIENTSITFASNTKPLVTYFKQNSTYIVPEGITELDILIVAGGGGGGGNGQISGGGGGGGGGIVNLLGQSVTPNTTYNIIVGNGGTGGNGYSYGSRGGNSSFGTYVAYGGYGGHSSVGGDLDGGDAGTGNTTGTGGRGQYSTVSSATNGGNGYYYTQLNQYFGGGGGGGNDYKGVTIGGIGGGGSGGHSAYANNIAPYNAENGAANTGGGGGGAARDQGRGANGGSGVVIVLQKYAANSLQTNKLFDVNNTKDDIYVKSIKIAKYKINSQKKWTFVNFIA